MGAMRPLRDAFGELSSGAGIAAPVELADFRAEIGYPDLPDNLLIEAIVNYADTVAPEVAEQLAPLVMAHTGIVPTAEGEDPADLAQWLQQLAAAQQTGAEPVDLDGDIALPSPSPADSAEEPGGFDELFDLDFGGGSDSAGPGEGADQPDRWETELEGFAGDEAAMPSGVAEPSGPDPVEPPSGPVDPFFEDVSSVGEGSAPTVFPDSDHPEG